MNSLRKSTLIIFGLIMLGAIIRTLIPANYDKTPEESISYDNAQQKFHYLQLHRVVSANKLDNYQIVDLRTPIEFNKEHIPGAVNIPFQELASSDLFKDGTSKKTLLYADDEAKAASSAMMFLQMGDVNVQYIPGNFETIKAFALIKFDPEHAFYTKEKMKYNYGSYFSGRGAEPIEASKPVTPQIIPAAASGGC